MSRTWLPTTELVQDVSQGVQLAFLQELAQYWAEHYDCGRLEERLNALPQYETEIDELDIHFIHVKSENKNASPRGPETFADAIRELG